MSDIARQNYQLKDSRGAAQRSIGQAAQLNLTRENCDKIVNDL